MIYAVVGALMIGLSLGIFGSGGSILTVPVLIYLLHHEDKAAITESLAIVGSIALVNGLRHAIARAVNWRSALFFGVPGMAGTSAGAWAAGSVPGFVQLFVFAGVMLLAAWRMWRRASEPDTGADGTRPGPPRPPWRIVIDGIGVGVLTGFVGVGGGFLIVPALVLLGGLPMRTAVATSLVIITMNSAVGFWTHLGVLSDNGHAVDWRTIGLFIGVGLAGSLGGGSLGRRLKQSSLQRGFAVFLVAMAGYILVRETAGLIGGPGHAGTPSTEPAPGAPDAGGEGGSP